MNEKVVTQIQKIARNEGYEEIVLNASKKTPIAIEGIKGHFVPEVLCYTKGELQALVTLIESLDDVEEFYKLTLFMDYANKNNLYLYIAYDERRFSHGEIVQKLTEKGVEIPDNTNIVAISL